MLCQKHFGRFARVRIIFNIFHYQRFRIIENTMTDRQVMRRFHFVIAFLVVVLDRATKWIVATHISLHDGKQVIPGFFRIIHAENRGAAFGLFADSPSQWKIAMLVLFSIVALVVVSALLWRNSHSMTTTGVGLALILGGALGNLWDRLMNGRVVDFLLFYIGQYQWPAFNVADSAIVVGAGLLVIEIVLAKPPAHEQSA
jgi:signal peptidase II